MNNKRSIYIADTPFQIIMCILILRKFNFGTADIIITDHVRGIEKIADRLMKINIFDNVYLTFFPKSKKELFKYIFLPADTIISELNSHIYSDMFVCMSSFTSDTSSALYTAVKKANDEIKVHGYAEGYSSYTDQFKNARSNLSFLHKAVNFATEVFGIRSFIKRFDGVYVFHPSFFVRGINDRIIDITGLDISNDTETEALLFDIFGYVSSEKIISEKYIFFEECFSEDKNKQQDIEIVAEIAGIVGKENIIIKRHPRNKLNRFGGLGYKTMLDQEIPWEIFALDHAQTEHIYISYSSGAALNFRFFTQNNCKTILLYKCFKESLFFEMNDDIADWFEKYAETYKNSVYVPKDKQELLHILNELSKRDE